MTDLWRTLRIGDQVKIVEWPVEYPRDRLHPDTVELYEWLIETGAALTIVGVDEDEPKMPWGEVCRFHNGSDAWESVGLNHGGLEIVKRCLET